MCHYAGFSQIGFFTLAVLQLVSLFHEAKIHSDDIYVIYVFCDGVVKCKGALNYKDTVICYVCIVTQDTIIS